MASKVDKTKGITMKLRNFRNLSFENIRIKTDIRERFSFYYWILLIIPSIGKHHTVWYISYFNTVWF